MSKPPTPITLSVLEQGLEIRPNSSANPNPSTTNSTNSDLRAAQLKESTLWFFDTSFTYSLFMIASLLSLLFFYGIIGAKWEFGVLMGSVGIKCGFSIAMAVKRGSVKEEMEEILQWNSVAVFVVRFLKDGWEEGK